MSPSANDRFAQMLAEARKYGLGPTLAHQHTSQLVHGHDTEVLDAVLGNVGTIVAFRLGCKDAQLLERAMAPRVNETDITGLPNYLALVRSSGRLGHEPFSMRTLPASRGETGLAAKIRSMSSSRHGKSKEEVDNEINAEFARLRALT